MKKRINILVIAAMTTVMLVGCKASEEKLAEVNNEIQEIEELKTQAEDVYGNITDSSMRSDLDTLNAEEEEAIAVDYSKKSDKKIDSEVLPVLDELKESYTDILNQLNEVYEKEAELKEEAQNYVDIQAYIVNNSGLDITSIVIKDNTKETESSNIIGENATLAAGQSLIGAVLSIYTPSTDRVLVITDSSSNTYNYAINDMPTEAEGIITITIGSPSDGAVTISE